MTTYSFTVELTEQEMWSVEQALKFYLTPEATQLRKVHPELDKYSASIHAREILATKKLCSQPEMTSTSSFFFSRSVERSDDSLHQFVDSFASISQLEKDKLINDVAVALLRDPMPEFECVDLSQLIHSPAYEQRVLDQLFDMLLKDSLLIRIILKVPKHRYWFNEMVAKKIREKQMNV